MRRSGVTWISVVLSMGAAAGCLGGAGEVTGRGAAVVESLDDSDVEDLFSPDGCADLLVDPALGVERVPLPESDDLVAIVSGEVALCIETDATSERPRPLVDEEPHPTPLSLVLDPPVDLGN